MYRLVAVSNRVSVPGGATPPGGLATGLLGALRRTGGLWFGWNGRTTAEEPADAEFTTRDGLTFATIALPQRLFEKYYGGFSNGTLWPLFHYFLAGFHFDEAEHAAYEETNALFARTLAPMLQAGDLVWVHDYQLIPLGRELRALGVGHRLGFFLHIPFPHFEVLRALPVYVGLVRALLEYDLVGFQTDTDRQSFLGSVRAVWGEDRVRRDGTVVLGARMVRTGVFPIGVDVEATMRNAIDACASVPVKRMIKGLVGRRLIIGVDRLDYSKGLLERFLAYRDFLEHFPEEIGQVTYLQIAPLGRQNVPAYSQIRDALEQSSGRTNGRFADTDWTPIRYLNRNFPHSTLMGFLRSAQVCLVTPLRDGMNLVAKEFVAAQDPQDPGVLVLSDRTGAACELTEALLVNPYDTKGIARAIQAALSMSQPERQARHQKLLAALRKSDIFRWQTRFVDALLSARSGRGFARAGAGDDARGGDSGGGPDFPTIRA